MKITNDLKETIKRELVQSLSGESEIKKIIIFGSFLKFKEPADIDLAIFQESNESYLALAMKYRKLTRSIAKKITLDIIPIRPDSKDSSFLAEIESGELIYER